MMRVSDLVVGQECWVVPWAVRWCADGDILISGKAECDEAGGSATLNIRRAPDGIVIVDTRPLLAHLKPYRELPDVTFNLSEYVPDEILLSNKKKQWFLNRHNAIPVVALLKLK